MPTETTPLLSDLLDRPQVPQGSPSRPPTSTLKQEATQLIEHYKSSSTSADPTNALRPETQLASHLYALSILHSTVPSSTSIRSQLRNATITQKVHDALHDAIEDLLNAQSASHEHETFDEPEDEDEDLLDMMWCTFPISDTDSTRICAMQLLFAPYSNDPSPYLSHPSIRYLLTQAWEEGLHPPKSSRSKQSITPQRVQVVQLLSFLVLWICSVIIAIRPAGWISPYEAEWFRISVLEVVWCLWALSTSIQAFQTVSFHPRIGTRFLLLLPTAIAVFTSLPSLLNGTHYALPYTFLTVSIPFLTTHLLLPISPSLSTTFTSTLPLSVSLTTILRRGAKPVILLLPLSLVLMAAFSWAMNGDIFRLFLSFSHLFKANHEVNQVVFVTNGITTCHDRVRGGAFESEPSISPFSARLSLFLTITLIFLLSMMLSISRSLSTSSFGVKDGKRWRGGVRDEDIWEKEYGISVGRRAREVFGGLVLGLIDTRESGRVDLAGHREDESGEERGEGRVKKRMRIRWSLPPPLNLLLLPCSLIRGLGSLKDMLRGGHTEDVGVIWSLVDKVEEGVVIAILGGLCYGIAVGQRVFLLLSSFV